MTSTTVVPSTATYPVMKVPNAPAKSKGLHLSRLLLLELGLDLMTGLLAIELVFRLSGMATASLPHLRTAAHLHLAAFAGTLAFMVLLERAGTYRIGGSLLGVRETACILQATAYAALLLAPFLLVLGVKVALLPVVLAIVLTPLLLILQKQTCSTLMLRLRSKLTSAHRAVVYGHAENAIPMLNALLRSPKSRYQPISCFSDAKGDEQKRAFARSAPQVTLYSPAEFDEELLRSENVGLVVIASPIASSAKLEHLLEQSERAGATVLFGAETHAGGAEIEYFELDGKLLYGAHAVSRQYLYETLKRMIDIAVSAVLLVFAAIPMLLAALAVAIDTRGPILFKQTRVGLHGTPFTILKFRTMHVDMCGYKASPSDASDPRITRVGKWLRKTSIDELPQLLNILLGEMTLVGPRPEMPFIVAKYSDTQMRRLTVMPGLTGLWQISEDRRYPIHENMHYDLYYLKHRSISMDIALILHTAVFAIRGV